MAEELAGRFAEAVNKLSGQELVRLGDGWLIVKRDGWGHETAVSLSNVAALSSYSDDKLAALIITYTSGLQVYLRYEKGNEYVEVRESLKVDVWQL